MLNTKAQFQKDWEIIEWSMILWVRYPGLRLSENAAKGVCEMFGKMIHSELNKENRNRRRYLIVAAVISVIIIVSWIAIVYIDPVRNFVFSETASNKNLEESIPEAKPELSPEVDLETDPVIENSVEIPVDVTDYRTETEIYMEMHKMANTKIIADQVWGEIDITAERVNALISEISLSDFEDKEILLNTLSNWKNDDFSNAVQEHNYLWEKLNGTVGEAYELK